MVSANANGNGDGEEFTLSPAPAGYYGLVVWKNSSAERPLVCQYSLNITELAAILPYRIDGGTVNAYKSIDYVTLTWAADCNETAPFDYTIYIGNLDTLISSGGSVYDYTVASPVCHAGTDYTKAVPIPTGTDNVFFIVVPHNGTYEGSYGLQSNLSERPTATASEQCHPQGIAAGCI